MLPSNLLVSSPHQFLAGFPLQQGPPPPNGQYLTHLNNTTSTNTASISNHNLDQLNLARTVVLKNLSSDLSLQDLLNEVDHGPIEYCKMFSKPTPKHLLESDPSLGPTLKVCYISFINSKISILFHLKYLKNPANLHRLKSNLKDSKFLRIALNDHKSHNKYQGGSRANHQDYIKLKTLNYILDFGATRCLLVQFSMPTSSDEPLQDSDNTKNAEEITEDITDESTLNLNHLQINQDQDTTNINATPLRDTQLQDDSLPCLKTPPSSSKSTMLSEIKNYMQNHCGKFGEVEDFRISFKESEADKSVVGKVLVHFTSIDAAIKTYEHFLRRISHDKQRRIECEESGLPRKNPQHNSPCARHGLLFEEVGFHRDRCDRAAVEPDSQAPKNDSRLLTKITTKDDNIADVHHSQETSPDSEKSTEDQNKIHEEVQLQVQDQIQAQKQDSSKQKDEDGAESETTEKVLQDVAPNSASSTVSSPSISGESMASSTEYSDSHSYDSQPYPMYPQMPPYIAMPYHTAFSTPNLPMSAMPLMHHQPYDFNGNRTVYLGRLHPNTTIEEIANNVRAGGLVESIKYHPEKKVCFVTFIEAEIALKFYMDHQVLHQLIIHGHDVDVGWANKLSGPLNREIALAVTAGASRNVYIGIMQNVEGSPQFLPDEATFRKDFSRFGPMEQINFYHNKFCGFLNFLNIVDAIKVVECFELEEEYAVSKIREFFKEENPEVAAEFYNKYKDYKVKFAKDRCGNQSKFSFKKKPPNAWGSTYSQYSHLLHGSVKNRYKAPKKNKEEEKRDLDSFMEDTINQEAAMVFGIISKETDDEREREAKATTNGGTHLVSESEPEDETDNDSDDEVSIITNSDDASSFIAQNPNTTRQSDGSENSRPNGRKMYHSMFSRNSSSASLGRYRANSIPTSSSSSPYIANQQLHWQQHQQFQQHQYQQQQQFQQHQFQQQQFHQQNLYQGRPPYASASYSSLPLITPNPGYFPPQYYRQNYPPQHYQQPPKSQYSTSGSQVMAQYLAKSQHDGIMYASAVMQEEDPYGQGYPPNSQGYPPNGQHYQPGHNSRKVKSRKQIN